MKKNYHLMQQFCFWFIPKRTETRVWKRYLFTHVHCRIIYSSLEGNNPMYMDR